MLQVEIAKEEGEESRGGKEYGRKRGKEVREEGKREKGRKGGGRGRVKGVAE